MKLVQAIQNSGMSYNIGYFDNAHVIFTNFAGHYTDYRIEETQTGIVVSSTKDGKMWRGAGTYTSPCEAITDIKRLRLLEISAASL